MDNSKKLEEVFIPISEECLWFDGNENSKTQVKGKNNSPGWNTNSINGISSKVLATQSSDLEYKPNNIVSLPIKVVEEKNSIVANMNKISLSPDPAKTYWLMKHFLSNVPVLILKEKFLVFNGIFFEEKSKNEMGRLVVDICRNFITEKTSGFIDGIVDFMLKEPLIELKETHVPKIYVAFSNCVLNIRTGEILPNSPNLICLYAINAEYIPNGHLLCPVFDKYLNDITGGDPLLIETIWQFIGYILTPDTAAKKFFLLQGVQNSGKSVLCKIIEKLFSPNAIVPLDAHSFGEDFVASELADKNLCLCPDLPNEPLNAKSTSIIKQFTGNDSVSSKVKFKKNVTINTPAKFVLATNHPLLTKSPDEAFYERIITIPFKYSVPRESRNFNLIEEALNERNSIVTKAIFAYFRLVKNRYCFASEFPPNKVVMHCAECNETVLIKIYKFVRYNFEKSEKNYIFTDDIYNEFITKYGYVSLNEFSQIFIRFSEEAYGAKKIRKRRNNKGNPISAIQGIALKK